MTNQETRVYEVTAHREGRWWVFDIPALGTGGQARDLAEVEVEAQGVAAMWLDVEPHEVMVDVTVQGQAAVLAEWAAADRDEAAARRAQSQAADRRKAVVRSLRAAGWSAPDTGRVLGISKQRVYQLDKAN